MLRRLLRRAVRSMRLLGYEDRALPELLPVSRDKMGETYAELHRDWERISHGRLRRGGRVPPDAARRHHDLRPGGRRGEAVRRQTQLSGEQGVRAARHLRLPDRPDPRDGGRAGPRGRRGGLPPADERAARAGQGGRAGQEGPARRRAAPTARSPTRSAARSSSPATPRSSAEGAVARHRRAPAACVDLGARGRRGRAGPRPHAVLRRGRRPARRPGRHRARQRRAGSRSSTCSRRSRGLVVHQVKVLDGEVTAGQPRAGAGRHRAAPVDLPRAHRDPHGAQGVPRGARRHRDPGRLGERARAGSASTSPRPARCRRRR